MNPKEYVEASGARFAARSTVEQVEEGNALENLRPLLVATYADGQLTWTGESPSPGQVWTVKGVPMIRPAQALSWQPGQNSVLYLHLEGQLCPENTRGPVPTSSTCVAICKFT